MSRRALLILDAPPSETGAAAWRRYLMLARYFASHKFAITSLFITDGDPGAASMHWLMATADQVAVSPLSTAADAARRLDQREDFDVACALTPALCAALTGPARALRMVDLQAPITEEEQEALAQRLSLATLVLTAEPAQTRFVETLGLSAAEAPALIDGARKIRPRLRKSQLLAGVWVERDAVSINATRAFFDEVVARGGGGAPSTGGPSSVPCTRRT